mgnify:CR=1 FL=1
MIGGSTEGIAGRLALQKMSGAAASAGFGALLLFTAVLSLNIGLLNLLPIPILDGGTVCPDPCRIGHRTQSVTKDRLLYPDAGTIHNIDDIYFRVGE